MLRDAGATYAIVGHSERRTLFGDTDDSVNRKVRSPLTATLTPIVCIGETWQEREANRTAPTARGPLGVPPGRRTGRVPSCYRTGWLPVPP